MTDNKEEQFLKIQAELADIKATLQALQEKKRARREAIKITGKNWPSNSQAYRNACMKKYRDSHPEKIKEIQHRAYVKRKAARQAERLEQQRQAQQIAQQMQQMQEQQEPRQMPQIEAVEAVAVLA